MWFNFLRTLLFRCDAWTFCCLRIYTRAHCCIDPGCSTNLPDVGQVDHWSSSLLPSCILVSLHSHCVSIGACVENHPCCTVSLQLSFVVGVVSDDSIGIVFLPNHPPYYNPETLHRPAWQRQFCSLIRADIRRWMIHRPKLIDQPILSGYPPRQVQPHGQARDRAVRRSEWNGW